MKKLRSDALWHTFTPEQQKQIEQWLFEDHLSYQKTHELMKTELGITCGISMLSPLYHRLQEVRESDPRRNLADFVRLADDGGMRVEKLRTASEMLILSQLIQASTGRGNAREVAALGRLMLKGQDQKIRSSWVDVELKRHEYQGAASAPTMTNNQ